MKVKKEIFCELLAVMVMAGIVLSGCSDGMGQKPGNLPADLANTKWTRQIGSETVTLRFSGNTLKVQSDVDNSVNNGSWYCNGWTSNGANLNRGGCCYFGNNGYYNPDGNYDSIDFQYNCNGNTLNIYGCRIQSLNGAWTRV